MGLIIDADTASDALSNDKKGQHGLLDYVEILGETAERDVHVLKGL